MIELYDEETIKRNKARCAKIDENIKAIHQALHKLLEKYKDKLSVSLEFYGDLRFSARHYGCDEKYTTEMGFVWDYPEGTSEFVISSKLTFRGIEDTVSHRDFNDLENARAWIPVVEKFLEVEAERAGTGTE